MIRLAVQEAIAAGETCAACDTAMVITRDAIGRPRKRCPKCQGISHNRRHPDEVLLPQGLVRAMPTLPPVAAGQLRCQRCAHGVEGRARFCNGCGTTGRRPTPVCVRCHTRFTPSRKRQLRCDGCLGAVGEPFRLCSGCNRLSPRAKGGKARVSTCEHCRPTRSFALALVRICLGCGAESSREKWARSKVRRCGACRSTRTCLGCGATSPRPTRGRAKVKECAACGPASRVHPKHLPKGDPRQVAYTALRLASLKPKPCTRDGCGVVFQPLGPASKYCEAHR